MFSTLYNEFGVRRAPHERKPPSRPAAPLTIRLFNDAPMSRISAHAPAFANGAIVAELQR
jgi:hypothetical protein